MMLNDTEKGSTVVGIKWINIFRYNLLILLGSLDIIIIKLCTATYQEQIYFSGIIRDLTINYNYESLSAPEICFI